MCNLSDYLILPLNTHEFKLSEYSILPFKYSMSTINACEVVRGEDTYLFVIRKY